MGGAAPIDEAAKQAFMRRAIALSREQMEKGAGGPFGAVVVLDGKIVGEGWNQVLSANDPTAYAEIVAIRNACHTLGRFSLEGAVIFTSCEPCPMCLSAIHWARIAHIYYGNCRVDAAAIGFDDDLLYAQITLPPAERIVPGEPLLADEAKAAFDAWAAKADKVRY